MNNEEAAAEKPREESTIEKFVTTLNEASNPFAINRMIQEYIISKEPGEQADLLDQLDAELGKFSDPDAYSPCLMFNTDSGRQKLNSALSTIEELRKGLDNQASIVSQFKISDKLSKADFIRLLNVMYELKYIHDVNGLVPSKKEFMKVTGNFFSMDLSKYDENLSQGHKTDIERYLNIFLTLSSKAQEIWTEKQNSQLPEIQHELKNKNTT